MQIRVSPGIVGPVLRSVVVVLIGGPMKRSVGSMGLKSSVPRASKSFVCRHGSFQPLWPEPQQYATSHCRGQEKIQNKSKNCVGVQGIWEALAMHLCPG